MKTPSNLMEAAHRARGILGSLHSTRKECSFEWRPLPEPVVNPPVNTAVDGGSYKIDTAYHTFYAVKAWAGLFNPRLERWEQAAHVGIVAPPLHAEDRISIYREALEAYLASRLIPGNGLLLFDGSIRPVVKWWRPGFGRRGLRVREALQEARRELEKWASSGSGPLALSISYCRRLGAPSCLETLITESPLRPAASEYVQEVIKSRGEVGEWIILAEVAEKLYLYMEAIQGAWEKGATPIFITKTIRQSRLCKGPHPDPYYIHQKVPWQPGYTVWEGGIGVGAYEITRLGGEEPGPLYPDIAGIKKFYEEELALVEAYARLSRGGPLLLIGIVVHSREVPDSKDDRIPWATEKVEQALSMLRSLPGPGYPIPLFVAHQRAKIDGGEARAVSGILGLEAEVPDRLMLSY